MAQYHGVKPPTTDDAKMAMSHLVKTIALDKSKIAEHQVAKKKAQSVGNKKSVNYNQSHIDNHQDDVDERQQSVKTLKGIRGSLKPLVDKMAVSK